MNSLLGINFSEAESERVDLFLIKIEEIKKLLKQNKSFFLEFSSIGDQYGKLIIKAVKTHSTLFNNQQNDPASIVNVILEFFSIQELLGKNFNSLFGDMQQIVNTKIDEFYEKLNGHKKRILELESGSFKPILNAKSNFLKFKQKYEKNSKETDQMVVNYRKCLSDPTTMYNHQIINKMEFKAKSSIKETLGIETTLKNCSEEGLKRNEKWNNCLIESFQLITISYRGYFDKMNEIYAKYFSNYFTFTSNAIKLIKEKNTSIQSQPLTINEEKENQYLEDLKINLTNAQNNNSNNTTENLNIKGLYHELLNKIIQSVNSVKDNEIHLFVDLAQKHLEAFLILIEERRKIYKNLKYFISDISQINDNFAKSLTKNSKNNSILSLGNTLLIKKNSACFDSFFNAYETFSKKMTNFALFINIKVATLENILKEHKNFEKNLATTINKTIRDIFTVKMNLAKGIQNYEKMMVSIVEAEKLKNDVKLNQLKKETEECFSVNKEIMLILRKNCSEAANTFSKAYKDFRNHEQLNLQSIKLIIDGTNTNLIVNLEDATETIRISSETIAKKIDFEQELKSLLHSDEKLVGYIDKNVIEEEDFAFEKVFYIPNDIKIDEEPNLSSKNSKKDNLDITDDESKSNIAELPSKADEIFNEDSADIVSIKPDKLISCLKQEKSDIIEQDTITPKVSKKIENANSPSSFLMEEMKESGSNTKIIGGEIAKLQSQTSNNTGKEADLEEFALKQKFNLNNDEKLISSFSCAFAQKILLQGRLYVFGTRICFHSYFNSQTLFGNTMLNIPKEDILKIEKRTNAKFFDNAIAFVTKNGELFFASFMYRDQAFNLLNKILFNIIPETKLLSSLKFEEEKPNYLSDSNIQPGYSSYFHSLTSIIEEPKENIEKNEVFSDSTEKFSGNIIPPRKISKKLHVDIPKYVPPSITSFEPFAEQLNKLSERKAKLFKELFPANLLKERMTHFFEKSNVKDIFIALFSDANEKNQFRQNNKSYFSFAEYIMDELKDENITINKWKPSPPKFYNDFESFDYDELIDFPDFSYRELTYIHPVREKVLFAPKTSSVLEKMKVFWLDHREFVVQIETYLSKIPYADCFIAKKSYHFQEIEEKKGVQVELGFFVEFLKSTIFQSRIDRSTIEETKDIFQNKFIPCTSKVLNDFYSKIRDKYGGESLLMRSKAKKIAGRKSILNKEQKDEIGVSLKDEKNEKLLKDIEELKEMIVNLKNESRKRENEFIEKIDSMRIFLLIGFFVVVALTFLTVRYYCKNINTVK